MALRGSYVELHNLPSPGISSEINGIKHLSIPPRSRRFYSHLARPFARLSRPKWLPHLPAWMKFSGWRATIFGGAIVSIVALIINVVVLVWGKDKPIDPNLGNPKLFEGSCSEMQSTFTWSHLGINVVSTLLLGASNAAIQCLSAPTREEVDEYHGKGQWLDVGISGFLNWKAMKTWRRTLWILLALTSLPLHFL